jgi:hypothetical protein
MTAPLDRVRVRVPIERGHGTQSQTTASDAVGRSGTQSVESAPEAMVMKQ